MIDIAIIGAGLIGKKRALGLPTGLRLSKICDVDLEKGEKFAKEFSCIYEKDWKNIITDPGIKAVIVSTTNNFLFPITVEAIKAGKHVLVEKPGGRNLSELNKIYQVFKTRPVVLMFGYNHRLHPAILLAKKISDSGKYGKIMFIRSRYGHGGRLGYEKEWRFDKKIAGGGELLDQGSHLIDLVNLFCGELNRVMGKTVTSFWETSLEDGAFFIISDNNHLAQLSVSCTEWKNIFSFEIMLEKAKIQIDGLGGSYGNEKLILYKMKKKMGPPDVKEFTFPIDDSSWSEQNKLFLQRIKEKNYSDDSIHQAIYVAKIINDLYQLNS